MLTTQTAGVNNVIGPGCRQCQSSAYKPSPITGEVAKDISQPGTYGVPIGPRIGASFAAAQVTSSTQGVQEMCAGTDLKSDWWKYALAAVAGYFFAKS